MQIHELNTFTGTVGDSTYLAIDNGTDTSKINASDIVTPLLAPIESDMSVLEARMDSFTNLAEGSTTGDAELIDGRVGADGVTYTNIGGAIRSQVSDLKSALEFEFMLVTPTEYYTLPNVGKDLNYLGNLVDNSGTDTSDYIDIDDLYDICRVVSNTTKYGMCTLCYYDANKTFIRRDLIGTDYDFSEYNGETVVWFNVDKDAKFIRFSSENNRGFKYWIVEKEADLGVLDDYVKQSDFDEICDSVAGNNKLNPAKVETGYYYDFNDGYTVVENASAKITPDFIEFDDDIQTLQIRTTDDDLLQTSYLVLIYFYRENGAYIEQKNYTFNSFVNGVKDINISDGAKKIRIFSNAGNLFDANTVCVSFKELSEFEPYSEHLEIKESALPDVKTSPIREKIIVNFGDSIFGSSRPPVDISTMISNITGATVYNCAFGGCEMSIHADANYNPFSMCNLADAIASDVWTSQESASSASGMPAYFADTVALLKTIDFSKVDIVTIGYGTNDWNNGTELDNGGNSNKAYFADALRYSIETLLTAFPNLKIFVCTQTYRFFMDASYNFVDDSNTHTNSHGNTLIDFVEKTIEVAEQYNLPYINNYNIGMGKYSRSYYFYPTDGTHPKPEGNMLIASNMANKLF